MGLDMYLSLKIDNVLPVDDSRGDDECDYDFLSGFDFSDTCDRFWAILDNNGLGTLVDKGSFPGSFPVMQIYRDGSVEINVAYWRKVNAVHQWFVTNCQSGNDNCDKYAIHVEQLAHLISVCNTILSDPFRAETLLAPQSGFFFGSTDLDEWYFAGVKYTAERLEFLVKKVLELQHPSDVLNGKTFTFYYRSSW